jgi:23S rRNA pseudouridine2605 synthase
MSSRSTSRKPEGRGARVQKVLADVGIGSRREIDRLVQAGRVVVDGRPAVPGDRLTGKEKVFVDGNRIRLGAIQPRAEAGARTGADVLLYHKPAGEITARRDPQGRKSVFDSLPRSRRGRWIEVDRLDINASGLQLFTADGELANRLVHASHGLDQRYAVRIRGSLSPGQIESLEQTGQGKTAQSGIESVTAMGGGRSNNWYEVRLRGGSKRDLRRSFDEVDAPVSRLIRIGYGPLELGRLPRGGHRLLEDGERNELLLAARDAERSKG